MQSEVKNWLVRTRTGEILGPFTQRELLEALQKGAFSAEDEIAESLHFWISAQTLTHRDTDEFTLTHTRNQTVTNSVSAQLSSSSQGLTGQGQPSPSSFSPSSGQTIPYTGSLAAQTRPGFDSDELTPTPTDPKKLYFPKYPPSRNIPGATPHWESRSSRYAPLVASLVVVGSLWLVIWTLKTPKRTEPGPAKATLIPARGMETESPFVRQMYSLIQVGEAQSALKQLTLFHEKNQAKGELDYLIPYSALLITQGDSSVRARKYLEQILSTPQANPMLKSRAHHWLGYLLLSENQSDMGESHFLEALQLNPKDPAARFNLGRAYLKQKKLSQALDYLNLAELEVPDLWLVHVYKGRTKAALGNLEEARGAFKKAVDTSPDRWITYLYYALFLNGALKETESAQTMMRKMLTRDPQYEANSPAPFGFYEEQTSYAEYLESFDTIMRNSIGEEREMGRLYLNYLMSTSSTEEVKRIEALAERGGLIAKVLALKVALDRDASLETIKQALSRLPTNLKEFGYYAYVLRGDAHTRLGLFAQAQQDLQTALLLEPQSAVARWAYAVLLQRTGKETDALNEIKGLLSYHPNYIPAIVSGHQF